MVTFRFTGSLVTPIRIPLSPAPTVLKPPLVVDAVKLPFFTLIPVALEKIVGVRFHIFTQGGTASVDNHANKLVLVIGMPEEV